MNMSSKKGVRTKKKTVSSNKSAKNLVTSKKSPSKKAKRKSSSSQKQQSVEKSDVSQPFSNLPSLSIPDVDVDSLGPTISKVSSLNASQPSSSHETLYRRLDQEIRERQKILSDLHTELHSRKSELDSWHDMLLLREQAIAQKEDKYAELIQLQHQIEDAKISLEYEKQEFKHEKEILRQQEQDIKKKQQLMKEQEKLYSKKKKVFDAQIDDDVLKLRQKFIITSQSIPLEQRPLVVVNDKKVLMLKDIQKAYDYLHENNLKSAANLYTSLSRSFKEYTQSNGQDIQLYNDIYALYKDIIKQKDAMLR